METLNDINIVLQIITNICIVCITLYTTFLQLWSASIRGILVEYKRQKFFGEYFILQLYNTSLSSISIREVYLIFNNKKKLLVKQYDVPF